jgi:hypothetical protein
LLGCLYARASRETVHEWREIAGTAFRDYALGDGRQAYYTCDGEDAGGSCHAIPPA